MNPNLPHQDLHDARPPRNVARVVAVTLLILMGGYAVLMYLMSDSDSDPDRPPIIISSGSIYVDSEGEWIDKGNKGYKHEFNGKSVKTFSATTGIGPGGSACSVEGETIVVTYGSKEITFKRKPWWPFSKRYAFAQFAADENISQPSKGRLEVNTTAALVSFRNESGNSCNVQDGRLAIQQRH